MKERAIYEDVLLRLGLPTLHYYGCLEEGDGRSWWLFLEDAGRQQYSPLLEAHRNVAGSWLGRLHSAAADLDLAETLPDRGPHLYQTYLRSVLTIIPRMGAMALLPPDDRAVLESIVSICALLAEAWDQIEAFCDPLPHTFIHDDCLAKNVHVRYSPDGLTLAPFDWGGAGWGLPATDLGQLKLPYQGRPPKNPDLVAYHTVVRERWPDLGVETIRRLIDLGQLFWSLKVISRCLPEFEYDPAYLEYVMYNFRIYETILADAHELVCWLA